MGSTRLEASEYATNESRVASRDIPSLNYASQKLRPDASAARRRIVRYMLLIAWAAVCPLLNVGMACSRIQMLTHDTDDAALRGSCQNQLVD